MTHMIYRGWAIDVDPVMGVIWTATSPNYDASTDGPEGSWVDNGEMVTASTYKDLLVEIENFEAARD